jgi:hypothetical protein
MSDGRLAPFKEVSMVRILVGILATGSLYAQTGPSTFTVTTLADSGPGSLRQAIVSANAEAGPNRIIFASGLHGAIVLTTGALGLAKSTEIDGPGAELLSVSGGNAGRVFEIEKSANVTIHRLSIANGRAAGNIAHPGLGGGIYIAGGALTLDGVNLVNNRAIGTPNVVSEIPAGTGPPNLGVGAGGGIYVVAGTLTVTNSLFANNQALGAVGGPVAGLPPGMNGGGLGGGIFNQGGTLTLTSAAFVNNQALGGAGGTGASGGSGLGGGLFNSSGGLSVTTVVLAGNQAAGGSGGTGGNGGAGLGGGIVNFGQLGLSASLVSINSAQGGNSGAGGDGGTGSGGGIYDGSGGVVVLQNDSILAANSALGGNCGFPGCGTRAPAGDAFGGGLYGGTGSVLTIGAARIVGNRATGATGTGGGIYAAGTLTLSPNAIVTGNFASTADPNIFPPGA